MQCFLRGTVRDTINPKNIWHRGLGYLARGCQMGGGGGGGGFRITVAP